MKWGRSKAGEKLQEALLERLTGIFDNDSEFERRLLLNMEGIEGRRSDAGTGEKEELSLLIRASSFLTELVQQTKPADIKEYSGMSDEQLKEETIRIAEVNRRALRQNKVKGRFSAENLKGVAYGVFGKSR